MAPGFWKFTNCDKSLTTALLNYWRLPASNRWLVRALQMQYNRSLQGIPAALE